MKRLIIFLTMLLIPLQVIFPGDKIRVQESVSFYSKILNQEVKYSISLPQDYFTSHKNYPVVYLLHGLGDDESSWLEYGSISQVSDCLVKSKETVPMIFVMPQGFRNYYVNNYDGSFQYQEMFVKELVKMIDSLYRTIPDTYHRATMGYSMGGFGALVLPLEFPELFTVSVPLSISIRTDTQYMAEESPDWDQQWGKLFGGVGLKGEARLTDYYKASCPFHILRDSDPLKYKDLKLYIDNGDDEHTLCRSNEELHILLRNRNIPHEFRVRNGGHEFTYWKEALPNGLRFISDAFEGKAYRGDIQHLQATGKPVKIAVLDQKDCSVVVPAEYNSTNRLYPAIYFMGDFNAARVAKTAELINSWTACGSLSPVVLVFLKGDQNALELKQAFAEMENQFRVRKGYRFRSVVSFGEAGKKALDFSIDSLVFTSCAVLDGNPDAFYAGVKLSEEGKEMREKTGYYIDSPDKGPYYTENGNLHILFRESDFYHEYRVREGAGGFDWCLAGLFNAMDFSLKKIHR